MGGNWCFPFLLHRPFCHPKCFHQSLNSPGKQRHHRHHRHRRQADWGLYENALNKHLSGLLLSPLVSRHFIQRTAEYQQIFTRWSHSEGPPPAPGASSRSWGKQPSITVSQLKSLFIYAVISIDLPFNSHPSEQQTALKDWRGVSRDRLSDWLSFSAATVPTTSSLSLNPCRRLHKLLCRPNKTLQDWKLLGLILLQEPQSDTAARSSTSQ